MASSFAFDTSQLEAGLNRYPVALDQAVQAILSVFAEQAEGRAKAEHPWQNRTGAAEAGLNAGVEAANHIATLYLQHGKAVTYGWWLETRWGGRFSVIQPVLESTYAPVMDALRRLVR